MKHQTPNIKNQKTIKSHAPKGRSNSPGDLKVEGSLVFGVWILEF
jgi:hypothetical protein